MLGDLFALDDEEAYAQAGSGTSGTAYARVSKPPPKRAESNFVGLENQGATCYLNSLIQSMFMTPELRDGMFAIDPVELGSDVVEEAQQQAAEDAKMGLIEVNEQSLAQLTEMGIPEHQARRALVGTKSGSLDAVFAYIDAHENDPEFNKPPEPEPEESGKRKKKRPRLIPLELQRLFTQLKMVDQHAVSTHELTTKGFEWQNMDGQVQHDAHELNRLLIDALEKSLKRTSGETLCRNLYEGRCANQIKCLSCHGVSERPEPYYDINLQILDCPDLCVSLRRHCAAELLTGDSAYQCDNCRGKRDALRSTVLRTLPQVLTFSCSRFRIDRSTNWNRVKLTSRSEFPLAINMRPYMEGSASGVHEVVHSNADVERDLTDSLRRRDDVCWLDEILTRAERVAKELLEQYGEAARLADVDDAQYEAIARHLAPHWFAAAGGSSPEEALLYELHAVIMHRGSAHSGHYFAYIKDNLSEGKWVHPQMEELATAVSSVPFSGQPPAEAVSQGAEASLPEPPARTGRPGSTASSSKERTPPKPAPAERRASSGKSATPAKATAAKQYVLQSGGSGAPTQVCVDVTSPLACVLQVMLNSVTSPRRPPADEGKKPAKSHPGPVYKTDFIAAEVAKALKKSWSAAYRDSLGSLEHFMRGQSDLFKLTGKGEVTLLNSNVRFLPSKEYQPFAAPTTHTNGDTGPLDTEQSRLDEALARSLQMEDDIERHSQARDSPHPAASADSEWETAGAKKKTHQSGSGRGWEAASSKEAAGQNGASIADTAAGRAVAAAAQLSAAEARKQLLISEILGHFYGHYFEFNDSTVSPIELGHLAKAFDGPDSAYLLVYRRLAVSHDSVKVLADAKKRLQTEQAIEPAQRTVSPPALWANEVAAVNATLQEQRSQYELSFSNVTLAVHCPAHLRYESPLLYPVTQDAANDTTAIPDDIEAKPVDHIRVDIDGRKTVRDLKQLLLEQHGQELTALGIAVDTPCSKLVVSTLQPFGEGYYPLVGADENAPLSEALGCTAQSGRYVSVTHVVLWDGATLHGAPVLSGLLGYPKQLSVSLLSPGTSVLDEAQVRRVGTEAPAVGRQVPVQEHKLFPSTHLPSSLSLLEFAHSVCDMCHVNRLRACISVICASSPTSGARKGERTYVSTPLYKNGMVSGKALHGVAGDGVASPALGVGGMVMTATSALGEFQDLQYVVVEDTENRGLQGDSLAEALVVRKNAEWTVTVELDFTPDQGQEQDGAVEPAQGAALHSVQVEIPRYITVQELRYTALKLLQLPANQFGETTRLRSGANRGELILSDEALDLVAAGLRNGSTLSLELGAKPPSDSAVVTVVLVTGNSTEVKYGPADAGVRGKEVELTVSLQDTVEDLRDQAGALLLGYAPGWTKRSDVLTRGTGARDYKGEEVELPPTAEDDGVSTVSADNQPLPSATPSEDPGQPSTDPASAVVDGRSAALAEFGTEFHGRRLRRTTWLKEPTELAKETVEETIQNRPAPGPVKKGVSKAGTQSTVTQNPPGPQPAKDATGPTIVRKAVTVKEAGIKSGDTLLLEEGTLRVEGQLELQLFIWKPAATGTAAAVAEDADPPQAQVGASALDVATAQRRACLLALGTLTVHERDAMAYVQSLTHALMQAQAAYLQAEGIPVEDVSSAERLLMRELKNDLLPGRCYWTSESAPQETAVSAGVTPSSAAKGAAKATAKAPATATVTKAAAVLPVGQIGVPKAASSAPPLPTLKKLNILTDRGLVVEILSDRQAAVRPPPGAMKLWVQILTNPGAAEGQAVMQPAWPPLPALLNGGAAPTLGHLKRAMGSVAPHIPSEHLSVYKYQPQAIEWTGLVAGGVGLHLRRKGSAGGKKGADSNVAQAPYFLKEGDRLVVFDTRLVRLAPGATTGLDGFIRIALPEEMQLRGMRDAEREERKRRNQHRVAFEDGSTTGASGGTGKGARKEVMLSLGSGFDFSDEES